MTLALFIFSFKIPGFIMFSEVASVPPGVYRFISHSDLKDEIMHVLHSGP